MPLGALSIASISIHGLTLPRQWYLSCMLEDEGGKKEQHLPLILLHHYLSLVLCIISSQALLFPCPVHSLAAWPPLCWPQTRFLSMWRKTLHTSCIFTGLRLFHTVDLEAVNGIPIIHGPVDSNGGAGGWIWFLRYDSWCLWDWEERLLFILLYFQLDYL